MVVDKIGVLSVSYRNGYADYGDSICVRKNDISVLASAKAYDNCDNDHFDIMLQEQKIVEIL